MGSRGLTGEQAENALQAAGVLVNRNLIPFDRRPPLVTSGIRVGTPAVSFRGFGREEIDQVADIMLALLARPEDEAVRQEARGQVLSLCRRFPIYGSEAGERVGNSC